MTHPKARARNTAILADLVTGKYTVSQLAKKYNVSKQHIYNTKSEAIKRGEEIPPIKRETKNKASGPIDAPTDLYTILALRREISDLEKVIEDLIGRNKVLLRVIDRLMGEV